MARLTPYWFQGEAVDAVLAALAAATNAHPVAAIVTGGGKSLIAAMLVERLIQREPQARVMILAPSMELVSQNTEEALGYLPASLAARIGVYCAGLRMKDRLSQILFGTPQSVARQIDRFGRIDYVIADEAHTFDQSTKTGKRIVDGLMKSQPGVRFIALTATHYRMKGPRVVPLIDCGLFNTCAYDLTSGRNFNRLIAEGVISPIVAPTLRFPQINLDGVKTKAGDYDETELAARAMAVTRECVALALEHAPDRKHYMWFAVTVEHAEMIHRALRDAGESSIVIHGNLDKSERVNGIEAYLSKTHRHIVSVAMLTTGFNAKFVDCLVVLRATKSLPLFRQIVGRGFRMYPGKTNCLLFDAGGNLSRHGPINAPVGELDSRVGLWECSEQQARSPIAMNAAKAARNAREKSAIRFPVHSGLHVHTDLRLVLGLMDEDTPACGYLNDAEHLVCRQCGRPRQGFLAQRERRLPSERNAFGDEDGYELHDEDAVILRDELCDETRTLDVRQARVTPLGNSVLTFTYDTDFGSYDIRLDFDRKTADNKFFAQARKFWEAATGRKVPSEAYRVLLQRDLVPPPVDITLTKYKDNRVFLTEVRWLRDGQYAIFRYDPSY